MFCTFWKSGVVQLLLWESMRNVKSTFHEPKTYDIEILLNAKFPVDKTLELFFGPKIGNEKAQIIINLII